MLGKDMLVGVLMGGTSAERAVSLKSGEAVSRALHGLGYRVKDIDVDGRVCETLLGEKVDVAFLALHGGAGEDGSMQGLLQVMGIPYTGSGVMASAIAMDKLVSKQLFAFHGLRVPRYEVLTEEGVPALDVPLVVKPAREGSSVGVSVVTAKEELLPAVKQALAYAGPVLLEEYIRGKEVHIAVLGKEVLGGVEVRPKTAFYSFEAKYTPGMTEYVLPPELAPETYSLAAETALRAHRALGCAGATRVDLLVPEDGLPYVLEVNTIPGMTETSLLPKIALRAGLEFPALIERILMDALGGKKS